MMKSPRLALLVCSVVVLLTVITASARSQGASNAPDKPNEEVLNHSAASEEEIIAELSKLGPKNKAFFDSVTPFRNVDARLHSLMIEYNTPAVTPERKDKIQEEFDKLLLEAEKCRKLMVNTGIEAFKETPFDNPIVFQFCLEMLRYETMRDNFEVAFQFADMFLAWPDKISEIFADDGANFYSLSGQVAYNCMQFDKAEQWYAKAVTLKADFDNDSIRHQKEIADQKQFWADELAIREKEAQADNLPRVLIRTNKGDITLELFEDHAPNTVANFISLVKMGFYKDVPFHRVLEGFMAQGGDPTGTGSGGPGYQIDCECYAKPGQPAPRKHFRGSISMANAGRDTNGSQFFLMFAPTNLSPMFSLNGKHTVFGRIIEGMDVLADIQRINPEDKVITVVPDLIIEAKVLRDRGHDYKPAMNKITLRK